MRETSFSSGEVGSEFDLDELDMMFSAANRDSGRLLVPVDPLELGRCCHDRVPARVSGFEKPGDDVDVGVAGSEWSSVKPARVVTVLLFKPWML